MQTGQLETTELHCLTFLGTRNLKSRCCQGRVPSEAIGKNPFLLLPASGNSWYSLASDSVTPSSAPPHGLLKCVSHGLLMRTPGIGFRTYPHSVWSQLTLTTSARTCFPIGNFTIPWHSPQHIQFNAQHWHIRKE